MNLNLSLNVFLNFFDENMPIKIVQRDENVLYCGKAGNTPYSLDKKFDIVLDEGAFCYFDKVFNAVKIYVNER